MQIIIITDDLDEYDLEIYIAEIINNEFVTIIEDGSLITVSGVHNFYNNQS